MKHLLLDTNIVIYSLNGDSPILRLLESFKDTQFHISMVSWVETLAGSFRHGKEIDEILWELECFHKLPFDDSVGRTSAIIIQERLRRGKKAPFQDSLIAATGLVHHIPLLTNNPKDFRGIKGLKVIAVK